MIKILPCPRYMSLTEWAPIWDSGVPPCTVPGDPGPSEWYPVAPAALLLGWLPLLLPPPPDEADEGRSYSSSWLWLWWWWWWLLCPPLPLSEWWLTRSPLAPGSTSLPVDDSTWQIYVAASCHRAAGLRVLENFDALAFVTARLVARVFFFISC